MTHSPITIKFSHRYKKMPEGFELSRLTGIDVVNLEELDSDFLAQDTAIVGGGHYPLPRRGKFMILYIETSRLGINLCGWQTIRRWTEKKEAYYRKHIGEVVECKVV